MSERRSDDRPALVFDVLGTLVDQTGGLTAQVIDATGLGGAAASGIVTDWLACVAEQERAIAERRRGFAPSHELDREALERLAGAGALPSASVNRLASASERLRPWPDSRDGIERLAADFAVLGLSNASRRTLTGLSSNSGLRWHQLISAEDTGSYKPSEDLYKTAIEAAPSSSGAPFMVAAHAWDLRAAAAAGMRTVYVPRPNDDPPRADDAFDIHASDLRDLHARLAAILNRE
ncbi:haloacid dehalogenase type II [Actinomadura sp. 7K507]|nr:haloacid dehalogenase type II [Actinomadura sp. 7K507]